MPIRILKSACDARWAAGRFSTSVWSGWFHQSLQQQMVSAFFHILERDYGGLVDDLISLGFLK